jgi:hypothetical protein
MSQTVKSLPLIPLEQSNLVPKNLDLNFPLPAPQGKIRHRP